MFLNQLTPCLGQPLRQASHQTINWSHTYWNSGHFFKCPTKKLAATLCCLINLDATTVGRSPVQLTELLFQIWQIANNLDQFWILSFCKAAPNKILNKPYKILSKLYICKLKFTKIINDCKMWNDSFTTSETWNYSERELPLLLPTLKSQTTVTMILIGCNWKGTVPRESNFLWQDKLYTTKTAENHIWIQMTPGFVCSVSHSTKGREELAYLLGARRRWRARCRPEHLAFMRRHLLLLSDPS